MIDDGKTCKRGHELIDDNLLWYWRSEYRGRKACWYYKCRACTRTHSATYRGNPANRLHINQYKTMAKARQKMEALNARI